MQTLRLGLLIAIVHTLYAAQFIELWDQAVHQKTKPSLITELDDASLTSPYHQALCIVVARQYGLEAAPKPIRSAFFDRKGAVKTDILGRLVQKRDSYILMAEILRYELAHGVALDALNQANVLGSATTDELIYAVLHDVICDHLLAVRDYRGATKRIETELAIVNKYLQGDLSSDDSQFKRYLIWMQGRARSRMDRCKLELERELYGPDYVLYRKAQYQRIKQGHYADAFASYEQCSDEYPETVYAQASQTYILYCLDHFSRRKGAKTIEDRLAELRATFSQLMEQAKESKPPADRQYFRTRLQSIQEQIDCLEKIPTGKAASRELVKRASAIIRKGKYDLYAGEALYIRAKHHMSSINHRAAEKDLLAAKDWCTEVVEQSIALAALEPIRDTVKDKAAPPKDENTVGFLGDQQYVLPAYDKLFNRQTSDWYLDYLKREVLFDLTFLHFAHDDQDTARKTLVDACRLDAAFKTDGAQFSRTARMFFAVENGYVFAYPQDLKHFPSKALRFAVLTADMWFVLERWDESQEMFGRIAAGEFGDLTEPAMDYVQYGIASTNYWAGNRDQAIKHYQRVLDEDNGTFTEDRAAYCIFNLSRHAPRASWKAYGDQCGQRLLRSSNMNEWVMKGRIMFAKDLLWSTEPDDQRTGKAMLMKFAKSKDHGDLAQFYLDFSPHKGAD